MATQTTTASQEIPLWLQQYYQEIAGRGAGLMDEPYTPYGAARIAGFTPEQEAAFGLAQAGIGSWAPSVEKAEGMIDKAGGMSAVDAARPYLSVAGSERAMTGVSPYLGTGTSRESLNLASPLINQAASGSALRTASPYLEAGTEDLTRGIGTYMNPYTESVVNRIGELSGRNLRENILPGVNRTFIGGGTFGGSRSQEFTNRAVRDANESALAEQNRALQSGFTESAALAEKDAQRRIQAAQTSGQLSSDDLNRALSAGKSYADIASDIASRNLQAGSTAGNVGLGDLSRIYDVGMGFGNLADADADRALDAARLQMEVGSQGQRQLGADVSTLSGIGASRQALSQRSADLAYQDFLDQRQYPMEQLSSLSQLTGRMAVPTSTTTTVPGPSTAAQAVGLGTSIFGALNSTGAFNRTGGSGGGSSPSPVNDMFKSAGSVSLRRGGRIRKSGIGWLKETA